MDNVEKINPAHWIEQNFKRLTCAHFISERNDQICGCGRHLKEHSEKAIHVSQDIPSAFQGSKVQWNVKRHTVSLPTNAFGIIEFEGTSHPSRAHYLRLAYNTKAALVLKLLTQVWNLSLPKLVISVLGDSYKMNIDPALKGCLSEGLFKAVHTTGGWIITNGINSGASEYIAEAFASRSPKVKSNTVIIGIAPWGVIEGRNNLVGKNVNIPYNPVIRSSDTNHTLNSQHSYFLLVDNGTHGSLLSTYLFRKLFERYLQRQLLLIKENTSAKTARRIPLISLSIAGSINLIKDVIECITSVPVVPVVICDGSSGASDLISFFIKNSEKRSHESLNTLMKHAIMRIFSISEIHAESIIEELIYCYSRRQHIAIFQYWNSDTRGLDHCILNFLLETHYDNYSSRLSTAISWNYADLARDSIYNLRRELLEGTLDEGMTEALASNKVEFVRLFLENGFSMQKFLTIQKLEELYNAHYGQANILIFLIKDMRKISKCQLNRIALYDVGLVIEKLLGFGFRCSYTRRTFKEMAKKCELTQANSCTFAYPYNELLIWAVLTKRHEMALFVWERGEQAVAKALLAMKLNKSLAREAELDDLSDEISKEFLTYAKEYAQLALHVLDQCHKEDERKTSQLLTYEMKHLSDWTCLFLASLCHHKEFIAHQSCQMLLNDLWMGGMYERKYLVWKVLAGIFFPPMLFLIEFKTTDELNQMPQTEEEHLQEMYTSESSSDSDSSTSDGECNDVIELPRRRRITSSRQSERTTIQFGESITHEAINSDSSICPSTSIEKLHENTSSDVFGSNLFNHGSCNQEIFNGSAKTSLMMKFINFMRTRSLFTKSERKRRHDELKASKKIYEFFNAPVTKFFENCALYVCFLVLYTYMVLIETPKIISVVEIVVWIYVLSLSLEMIMDFMTFPIRQHGRRLNSFFDFSTTFETVAILMFFCAFLLRCQGNISTARVIYCTNIIYWYLRMFSFLIVEKHIGPVIHIATRTIIDLLQFVVILLISMMAFGVNRQSIKFPNENFTWSLVKNIFLEPYYMLYGEVYAPDIDPICVDNGPGCQKGHWITPLTMSIYMIMCNVLLLSILIARLNSTFSRISSNSSLYWKFQRYHYVMRYEAKPILPAPFVIISFCQFIIKYIYRRICEEPKPLNKGLKVFLNDEEMETIHDFEEQCVEEFFYKFNQAEEQRLESKAMVACERVGSLCVKANQLFQSNHAIRYNIQQLESKISRLEEQNNTLFDILRRTRVIADDVPIGSIQSSSQTYVLRGNISQYYEPNSIAQFVAMMVPVDIIDFPSNQIQYSENQPSCMSVNDNELQGQLIDRVLRRRARKMYQSGDSSMIVMLNSRIKQNNGDPKLRLPLNAFDAYRSDYNGEEDNVNTDAICDVKMLSELDDPVY
ncbi:hypothetical protein GJ496_001038 [Pomphorhynchus laevis]|nr:hypothetical protein GJ496_001038 [Pomphorhynchus laevis]